MTRSAGILAGLAFLAIITTLVVGPASSVIVAISSGVSSHEVQLAGKMMSIPVGGGLTGLTIGRFPSVHIRAYTQGVAPTAISPAEPAGTDMGTSSPSSRSVRRICMLVRMGRTAATRSSTASTGLLPGFDHMSTSTSGITCTVAPASTTAQATMPTTAVTWATWTTTTMGSATGTATFTAQALPPFSSLLDRLVGKKPSVWGNRYFYVGLGVVYVILLVFFFRQVGRLSRGD